MKLYIDAQRRLGVVIDENPIYKRVLCVNGGMVDVVKMGPDAFEQRGFLASEDSRGAWQFANTFARSTLVKTSTAVKAIQEIQMSEAVKLTMKDAVAEYNRLTGKSIKRFESLAAAQKALAKLTEVTNAEKPNGAMKLTADQLTAGDKDMVAKKTKSKKSVNGSGDERAKKIWAAKRGAAALIVELIKEKKYDDEQIASRVIKKFPNGKTDAKAVAWYRAMGRRIGVRGI